MKQVDIKDFEDYQITDDGRVWSKKTNKWMILQTNKKNGYSYVGLMKNGKRRLKSIHRLVAEAFIPNPDNKLCIDHCNTIRTDNRVENLRWCSHKENMNNENSVIQMKKSHTGDKNWNYGIHWSEEVKRKIAEPQSKKVYQYTLDGELVKIWNSTMDCGRNGYSQGNVAACCRGKRGTHKNYIWKYE